MVSEWGGVETGYETLDRVLRYPLWFGVVCLGVGIAIHYLSVQTVRDFGMEGAKFLEPTPVRWSLGRGSGSRDLFGTKMFVGATRAFYASMSRFGLVLAGLGSLSVVVGLLGIFRRSLSATAVACLDLLTEPRRFLVAATLVASTVGFLYGFLTSPAFRSVATSVVVFSLSFLFVLTLSFEVVRRIERRAGPVLTVFVVGPLGLSTVFLSTVVATFTSPATSGSMRRVTAWIVRVLLLTVFEVGGLNRVLVDLFELEGGGFLLFWIGVDVAVGLAVGVAMVRYESVSIDRASRSVRATLRNLLQRWRV